MSFNQNCVIQLINFINLNDEDKRIVLNFRNHPDIRKWMYNKDKISLQEHLEFIKNLKNDKTRLYFLVKDQENIMGIIDYKLIDDYAQIGLYKNPSLRGVGALLMNTLLQYGFETLGLKRLVLFVFADNSVAIRLYKKFGFKEIDKKDNLIKMQCAL